MDITATKKVDDELRSVTANYDFGENLEGAVLLHNEDVVFSNYRASGKITIQGMMRRMITAKKSDEEIQSAVLNYKLGAPTERKAKDPTKAIMDAWPTMSEEDRQEFLKSLKKL